MSGAGDDTDDAKVATLRVPHLARVQQQTITHSPLYTLYTLHSPLYTVIYSVQCHNKTQHAASLMLEVSSSPGPSQHWAAV